MVVRPRTMLRKGRRGRGRGREGGGAAVVVGGARASSAGVVVEVASIAEEEEGERASMVGWRSDGGALERACRWSVLRGWGIWAVNDSINETQPNQSTQSR